MRTPTSPNPISRPSPSGCRLVAAAAVRKVAAARPRAVGRRSHPSTEASEATVSARPHRMASWNTAAIDASHSGTPPRTAIAMPAVAMRSTRPTGAAPRTRWRTARLSRWAATASTTMASTIEIVVSRPSNRSVTRRSGIRSSDGKGPK